MAEEEQHPEDRRQSSAIRLNKFLGAAGSVSVNTVVPRGTKNCHIPPNENQSYLYPLTQNVRA